MNPTFSGFLEPEGIIGAAGTVTGIVALAKIVFPALDASMSGALMAFLITGVLYILVAFATGADTVETCLVVIAAWLACGMAAVGIHSCVVHIQKVSEAR